MMEHKAFVFDYHPFEQELLPILSEALNSNDCTQLIRFIQSSLSSLTDPYEGEPLTIGWEDLIETADAHQYGDLALTKYYDPKHDIGLGAGWNSVQELMPLELTTSPILGHLIGPQSNLFDPGKLGSYFQSQNQVQESIHLLSKVAHHNLSPKLDEAVQVLEQALRCKKGLYVTF
jgi:hypothetical protein